MFKEPTKRAECYHKTFFSLNDEKTRTEGGLGKEKKKLKLLQINLGVRFARES